MVSVRKALDVSRKEALEVLVRQLADEIADTSSASNRLQVVRAFLATVVQLESMEAHTQVRTPGQSQTAGSVDLSGQKNPIDELKAKRNARNGRMHA